MSALVRAQTVPGCSDCVSDCNCDTCDGPAECTDQCRIVSCIDPNPSEGCNEDCTDGCSLFHNCENGSACEEQPFDCCLDQPEFCKPQSFDFPTTNLFNSSHLHSSQFHFLPHQYSTPFSNSGSTSTSSPATPPRNIPSGAATPVSILDGGATVIFENLDPMKESRNMRLPHRCLWNGCSCTFPTSEELVAHVNSAHLWWATQPSLDATLKASGTTGCMWDHCNAYPTANSIPSTSSGGPGYQPLANILTEHLVHDHLGLPQNPTTGATISAQQTDFDVDLVSNAVTTPEQEMTCTLSHLCHWNGCHKAFHGCTELHEHLVSEHIGSGKAQYECFWGNCPRNGDKAFSSKQKVLRHLQSHTGHRPFLCNLCGLYFSESATLQQHMRRHTSEKPYTCDHPGCGKSFTVKGALTIHQRIHNGEKPFKCTFCDRAFAESSNLSKHLRTHTGTKPYCCSEPDCEKRFARVDQLQRHAKVHKKL